MNAVQIARAKTSRGDLIIHMAGCADLTNSRHTDRSEGPAPIFGGDTLLDAIKAQDADSAAWFGQEPYYFDGDDIQWNVYRMAYAPCFAEALKAADITFDGVTGEPSVRVPGPTPEAGGRAEVFASAKAQFMARHESLTTGTLSELLDRERDLNGAIRGAQEARTKAERGLARSHLPKTLDYFNGKIADATESIRLWQIDLAKTEEAIKEERLSLAVAARETIDAFAAEVLSDYGKVQWSEPDPENPLSASRPTHVEFTPTGPMADGNTYAIVVRGDYSFEVGLVDTSEDRKRYFIFGYDVDVYAPRAGWREDIEPSKVNWGAHGATTVADTRAFARLLSYAADVAATVNEAFGL